LSHLANKYRSTSSELRLERTVFSSRCSKNSKTGSATLNPKPNN
jgi:hypothetical protein